VNRKLITKRIEAMTIDWIIASLIHIGLMILCVRFAYLSELFPKFIKLSIDIHMIIHYIVVILYFIIFEGMTNRTIGKMIFGLKVVDDELCKPSFKSILLRNFFRITDQFLLFGSVFLLFGESRKRLGDKLAKTKVVDNNSINDK